MAFSMYHAYFPKPVGFSFHHLPCQSQTTGQAFLFHLVRAIIFQCFQEPNRNSTLVFAGFYFIYHGAVVSFQKTLPSNIITHFTGFVWTLRILTLSWLLLATSCSTINIYHLFSPSAGPAYLCPYYIVIWRWLLIQQPGNEEVRDDPEEGMYWQSREKFHKLGTRGSFLPREYGTILGSIPSLKVLFLPNQDHDLLQIQPTLTFSYPLNS